MTRKKATLRCLCFNGNDILWSNEPSMEVARKRASDINDGMPDGCFYAEEVEEEILEEEENAEETNLLLNG